MHKALGYEPSGAVAVSKYFKAEESWTGKSTWWFNLPIKKVKADKRGFFYLLGEEKRSGFVILKVLNKFLVDNLRKFETRYQEQIRLHLTAKGKNRLVDERGKGQVDFSRFELKHPKDTKH